jgi:signal transduction histidine kinase
MKTAPVTGLVVAVANWSGRNEPTTATPAVGGRETPPVGPSEILHSVATLAAMASHEINNPLMVIVANLELLERTQALDAHGRARLGAALAAAGQIKEKVRRLGHITHLELAAAGPNLPPMLDLEKSSLEANGER